LGLLYKKLQKLFSKDYQPSKLPPGLRSDLEALAQSATILSQTDQSLGDLVASLEQVRSTGQNRNNPHTVLQEQVAALLKDLEAKLTVEDIEVDGDGHLDRSKWVNFSRISQQLPQVS
jgi:hypothetical protein